MSKFLFGPQILAVIKKSVITPKAKTVDLAVAYWGSGMTKALLLDKTRAKVRILCDLNSGFCDRVEMTRLLGMENVSLKLRNNLHSKVYLGAKSFVLGSSNASGRGLIKTSELEAAVFDNDVQAVVAAHRWFDALWEDEDNSIEITKEKIDIVAPLMTSLTFFNLLVDAATFFSRHGIKLIVFYEPDSRSAMEDAKKAWKAIKNLPNPIYTPAEIKDFDAPDSYPFYVDSSNAWTLSVGSRLISIGFDADKPNPISINDVWRVKKIGKVNGVKIIFGDWIQDIRRVCGLPFSTKDRKTLCSLIKDRVEQRFVTEGLDRAKPHVFEISAQEISEAAHADAAPG